jgi:hypothetical protein
MDKQHATQGEHIEKLQKPFHGKHFSLEIGQTTNQDSRALREKAKKLWEISLPELYGLPL